MLIVCVENDSYLQLADCSAHNVFGTMVRRELPDCIDLFFECVA
jgi:hypothetical protein